MQPSKWGSIVYEVEGDNLGRTPDRTSLLHIPSDYDEDTPLPLIVALHGKKQPPAEFEEHTQLSNPKVNDGYAIVAYPEGINLQWLGDPEAPSRSDIDDILFIRLLVSSLTRDYSIDRTRIYACGFSNGGGLTDLLAGDADASEVFAAFAIASGAFYTDSALKEPLFSHSNPSRIPIPILEFHGTSDPVIHYDGKSTPDGVTFSLPDFFEIWVKRNEMSDDSKRVEEQFDGKVVRYSWSAESESREAGKHQTKEMLIHYRIHGFGHGWPTKRPLNNDDQRHGPTYFDATPIVLDFFRNFRLEEMES